MGYATNLNWCRNSEPSTVWKGYDEGLGSGETRSCKDGKVTTRGHPSTFP